MSQATVFVTLKEATLKDWEQFASNLCCHLESREKCHFLLMKGDLMWVAVDGETSQDLLNVCVMGSIGFGLKSKVEVDSVGFITDEMWKKVVDFKFNERRPDSTSETNGINGLPPNHLIITNRNDSLFSSRYESYSDDGIWENPKIVQLNQFVGSLKKLWPDRNPDEFHSIIFKHPSDDKTFYLYVHVKSLTKMCLNASFKKIGYDFIKAEFKEELSLDKLNQFSKFSDKKSKPSANNNKTSTSQTSFWNI